MASSPKTTTTNTTATNTNTNTNNNNNNKNKEREYNPRWEGYFAICVMSLANFASVGDVRRYENQINNLMISSTVSWEVNLIFGLLSFCIGFLILLFDRIHRLQDLFDFKEIHEGKMEGFILLFLVLWWSVGVGVLTRADGIAYEALNIYFSAWLALGTSLHTLNQWSSSKDILSWKELTHLSSTLSSWYCLAFASMIEMGSAVDAHRKLKRINQNEAVFAVIYGAVTCFVSMVFILIHYKIFRCFHHGGLMELIMGILLLLFTTLALIILTADGAVAATITGSHPQCLNSLDDEFLSDTSPTTTTTPTTLSSSPSPNTSFSSSFQPTTPIPGSNLYISLWSCFASCCFVTVRWKAATALRFANAQDDIDDDDEQQRRRSSDDTFGRNDGRRRVALDDDDDDDI